MSDPLLAEQEQTEEQTVTETTADSSSTEVTEQQTTEQESTEATPAEEPQPRAPEAYEFQNPEGIPGDVDQEIHDAYAKAARELDLPQDQAQGLYQQTMDAIHKRAMNQMEARTQEWMDAAKSDSEYGGDKYQENLGIARKAVDEFGSDGLRELLGSDHEFGSHPEIVRLLYRVGLAVSEDRFTGSSRGGGAVDPRSEEALARKFYPNTPTS